ncbi:PadR family transcriptional regulator [Kibdelosporangium phytohabitans]|uniref:PadR family transcriptional regulator n=1 Tax=Kibdelosporangium phytohabitans TaxID=860235 RepID=A0A0N9HS25_9PSEU|nr:PadR family transcriptional regulator [Kibdelosporangium phytohabitans]ALG05577.1 PadR family transcriptional regulator [Kibdelosporangium phytohabitans]MBE1466462.1 DNA-binding PadR family transcriptional regulator [Kibdelosporangium phytohabitans]
MSLRHGVLGMLTSGPASGYDLLKRFEQSLANVWSATQSQLYGELAKMADESLVEVAAQGPRGRKEYAITQRGRDELQHWMTEVDPDPPRRSAMLLRVFFLNLIPPDQAVAYLRRQADLAAHQHAELAAIGESLRDESDEETFYGRIALEWGLRASTLVQEWAAWAETQVKNATRADT